MGCLQTKKHTRIAAMQTVNKDKVFTSTQDIHQIYNFGKVLGIGSFGKVLAAKMKSNPSKHYAIKVIDKRKVKDKEALLANEIYVLQQLDHPNIIKFHEVYQSQLYFYICMDYCQGGELVERIAKQQQNLTEGQVQNVISKICSAIAYIHERGIVHRDIKPENIMFTEKDIYSEPKLIDFGLANKYDVTHFKKLKTFVGTPLYLPPEVIDGEYDEKCDIWSLGVLIYSLICGYPPFYGRNRAQLYENIQQQQLIFDRKHWKNNSEEVKDLLRKMLHKNHRKRPSAKECLQHPWFKLQFVLPKFTRVKSTQFILKQQKSDNEDNRTIYDMLKNFRGGAKFKKEVTRVLINQMNEKELGHLKQVFQKIDVDNSGTITVEELRQALHEEGSPDSYKEIEQLIQTIVLEEEDGTEEGTHKEIVIKYSDFLAACIDERKILTREKLWSLFKYFDISNYNYITKEDIKEAFARHGRQLSDEKIDLMIYEIDPNHDNKISFDEFCQMMGLEGVEQTMEFQDEIKETDQNLEQD